MKKRILLSAMMVALVCALVGGATFAYFSDTATNSNNTFTAGTLDIAISPVTTLFTVGNMYPGQSVSDYITVVNDGTLDFKFKGVMSGTSSDTAYPLEDKLDLVVTLVETNGVAKNDVIYTGTVGSLLDAGGELQAWDSVNAAGYPFAPGWTAKYKIDVIMNTSADNNYQGDSFTGALTFYASQWDNAGWN